MHGVTNADREAAQALRERLADVSGFWHNFHDDSDLCRALAQHRAEAERRILDKVVPYLQNIPQPAQSDLPRAVEACGETPGSEGFEGEHGPCATGTTIRHIRRRHRVGAKPA